MANLKRSSPRPDAEPGADADPTGAHPTTDADLRDALEEGETDLRDERTIPHDVIVAKYLGRPERT